MYWWARHSSAKNEGRWHFVTPVLVAALGLAIASLVSQPLVVLIALTLGGRRHLLSVTYFLDLAG
jgi:hypothetical protein